MGNNQVFPQELEPEKAQQLVDSKRTVTQQARWVVISRNKLPCDHKQEQDYQRQTESMLKHIAEVPGYLGRRTVKSDNESISLKNSKTNRLSNNGDVIQST